MIGKRMRHMNRYRDIALALTRHGFGFIVEDMDIFHLLALSNKLRNREATLEKMSVGERIRLVLQDLGPAFIKLGQIASTRSDMIPGPIILELSKLQDQVEPFPFYEVREIVESELGLPLESAFTDFKEVPFAAASIGQVHLAYLQSGTAAAVKIQRPRIGDTIRTDLEILLNLSILAETRFEWARHYQIQRMVKEFSRSLLQELDYTIEGQNAEKIARPFRGDPHIRIPRVFWDLSSKKVLTTEFVQGIKLNDLESLQAQGYDSKKLADRLMTAMLQQIFIEGFFHADPHPGNILALPGEAVAFMDFGLVGRLTPEMRKGFSNLVIALMLQNSEGVMRALTGMGLFTSEVSMGELRLDIDRLREKYVGISFSKIRLGEAVNDLLEVASRHDIRIPTDFILLGKSLMMVEGVVEQLDPNISILQIAEPFGKRLLKEKLRPQSLFSGLKEEGLQYLDLFQRFPRYLQDMAAFAKKGRVEVTLPELELLLKKLDRISNRISFSIVMLAFSIIMTGLVIGSSLNRQASMLWNIPALEIGALIAVFMCLWIIHSIFRSGRF